MNTDRPAERLGLPAAFFDTPPPGTALSGESATLSGWALDHRGPLRTAALLVDGSLAVVVRLGLARPDVAAAYPEIGHAGEAGWETELDLRPLRAANVPVSLLACTPTGEWVELCPSPFTIEHPAATGRRARAVFTIVQNEPLFLPLWLDHYRRWFGSGDVYVLDHDSTDGSLGRIAKDCEVVTVHRTTSFDHDWLRATVGTFQRFLLSSYEAVLFAEVDELIVADPACYAGLDDYIGRLDQTAARCTGFNVVQQPDEPPLDFARPVLQQRRFWHRAPLYSKRLLARVPLCWRPGFHEETLAPPDPPDPNLLLLHLHRVDYDACLARNRAAAGRHWNERDLLTNAGWHNRLTDIDQFEEWFRRGDDLGSLEPEPIPERFRSLV